MMSEVLRPVLGLLWGALIGGIYFGGLWITVRSLPNAARPGLLATASYVGRLVIAVAGFVGAALAAGWTAVAAAVVGFVAVRIALVTRHRALMRDLERRPAEIPEGKSG
jgi:F1F0 ATPase subunit 2